MYDKTRKQGEVSESCLKFRGGKMWLSDRSQYEANRATCLSTMFFPFVCFSSVDIASAVIFV